MASSEDDLMDTVGDDVGDLFDDSDDAEPTRQLSDRELNSDDDENPREQVQKEDLRAAVVLDTVVSRHHLPKPFDGELNILRMPTFLGIEPRAYDAQNFKIPTTDHNSDKKSANFSASAIAASTLRYRKNLSTGKNESNAVVYRWSDGSTTIGVGDQQYELQSKPLAPARDSKTYSEVQDSHLYLASPSMAAQMLVVVGHMANQYTVRPNKDIEDDALERLQKSLAAATRGGHKGDDKGGPELITNTEDPELQKRKAELAEKERNKLQRRRETAAEKASLPKHSLGGRGGLNVDDLEGRSGRRAPGAGRAKGAKPRRRRPDYDSDDDELPRGRNREDEYDKEDDFLASSDEELEEGGGDDDEEELLDDESDREQPKSKRQKTSKPAADLSDADADADAEADLDDDEAPAAPVSTEPSNRGRKRLIIEEDDDDE